MGTKREEDSRRDSEINGCQRTQSGYPDRAGSEPAGATALTCPLVGYIHVPIESTVVLRTVVLSR